MSPESSRSQLVRSVHEVGSAPLGDDSTLGRKRSTCIIARNDSLAVLCLHGAS
jgi:hypothetical protein